MWAALLMVGCEVDKMWITGGGEVRVTLVGADIDEAFSVPGLTEEELDEVFSGGHQLTEVLVDLNFKRVDPGFAAGWHVQVGEELSWVELVHNDIVGFDPCDTSIRHAEWSEFLDLSIAGQWQFDERGPDEVFEGNPPPPATRIERGGESNVSFFPELGGLEGTFDMPVFVRCGSGRVSATLSVEWQFDEHVQRRAYERRWKSKSTSGPIGPAQL